MWLRGIFVWSLLGGAVSKKGAGRGSKSLDPFVNWALLESHSMCKLTLIFVDNFNIKLQMPLNNIWKRKHQNDIRGAEEDHKIKTNNKKVRRPVDLSVHNNNAFWHYIDPPNKKNYFCICGAKLGRRTQRNTQCFG